MKKHYLVDRPGYAAVVASIRRKAEELPTEALEDVLPDLRGPHKYAVTAHIAEIEADVIEAILLERSITELPPYLASMWGTMSAEARTAYAHVVGQRVASGHYDDDRIFQVMNEYEQDVAWQSFDEFWRMVNGWRSGRFTDSDQSDIDYSTAEFASHAEYDMDDKRRVYTQHDLEADARSQTPARDIGGIGL